jgi:hypothetical protein
MSRPNTLGSFKCFVKVFLPPTDEVRRLDCSTVLPRDEGLREFLMAGLWNGQKPTALLPACRLGEQPRYPQSILRCEICMNSPV